MATIGFVIHSQREGAITLGEETAKWLSEQGHAAVFLDAAGCPSPIEAIAESPMVAPGDSSRPAPGEGSSELSEPLDLAVSLGGDGTMLRAVDLVNTCDVPVLGVNLGHLGYLTSVEPADLREALIRFLAGQYSVESRMTLDVAITESPGANPPQLLRRTALNDVVLQRVSGGHTVRTEVSVNGIPFLTFVSDSLILATPTGSTAYNFSARGPIVSPKARVQILTPVAPHMLFDRSLVLDADDAISIVPIDEQPADIVVDGWRTATLQPGQTLHCRRGDHDARLVTFGERNFHRILKRKFNLTDR